MRTRFATALALLLIVTPSYAQELSLHDFLEVAGEVRAATSTPVENALVIAFSLSDTLSLRTTSGRNGEFAMPPLPVGVYRVVAVKRGYLPALATITPTKKDHRVVLELENQAEASEERKVDAWSIRKTLPRDVLREVELVLGDDQSVNPRQELARFAGSMESMAGYSGVTAERQLERTALEFSSDLGHWGVDFHGSRQLVAQTEYLETSTDPAEAANVVLEVRSSPSNMYRIASTRASWQKELAAGQQSGVETHSLAWNGGRSSVLVRYEAHENLFSDPNLGLEDALELAGNMELHRGRRSDLGVSVRLRQDSFVGGGSNQDAALRYADLSTNGRYVVADGVGLNYGLVTRVAGETVQLMPETGAEFRLGDHASVQLSGAYKFDATGEPVLSAPGMTYVGQLPTIDTRYRWSITVASEIGEHAGLSASARRAAADALTFLLFDDRFDEFWDGLYLERGDVLTDGVLSIRAGRGSDFEFSVVASAGRVEPTMTGPENKQYVSGEVRSHYEPSGTTLDVSYRLLEQPDLVDSGLLREIERLSIVLGQSLHLPVDLRLLVGFSVASERESAPAVADGARNQTRLVGGVSFSF